MTSQIVRQLREIPLFREIPAEELQAMAAGARLHRVDRGERVAVDGRNGGLYIVLAGSANVLRCEGERQTFLFVLHAGEFFPEPPLPRTAGDQSTEFHAASSFDLLEIDWQLLMRHLLWRPHLCTIVLERALTVAAEKLETLSREYFHLARQAWVSEETIQDLFPPQRPETVRTQKEGAGR